MARPTRHLTKSSPPQMTSQVVSGNAPRLNAAIAPGAAAVYTQGKKMNHRDDRKQIAQRWQIEAYRFVNIIGEARYAATLQAALGARAEIGVSEPQALGRKAVWVDSGPEVDVFAEIAPTVRERKKLARDYMLHRVIAGECYLIARDRRPQDPEYATRRGEPVWEIVAVTELQRHGDLWKVRLDNSEWVPLTENDPIIRMWNPDPENRRESWSPMKASLPVLREIEWYTGHIFTQIRSRLMSAGVWFLPENLTYPAPPPDMFEGGTEQMATMNEAELFMASLAASGTYELDLDEVSFPTVVMADPAALSNIDQNKLIKFWSEIDDKAMLGRTDAIRRFALGWDLPPEQVLGSSGVAISGSGGSAGSVNHWGEWASEEKTIAGHIEPALDDFVGVLTTSVLRPAVPGTKKVIAYDPSSIRMKQDRSKEALALNERGILSDAVTLREVGFDPDHDLMTPEERKQHLLMRMLAGSPTPEMMIEAMRLLGQVFEPEVAEQGTLPKGIPGRQRPPSLEDQTRRGAPEGDHEHHDAPYGVVHASCEVLVLRALEKAGNRLLTADVHNKRGKTRDRKTPPHLAHMVVRASDTPNFDFSLLPVVLSSESAVTQTRIGGALLKYCNRLYREGEAYTRDGLMEALEGLA